jgi:hypothetical protein
MGGEGTFDEVMAGPRRALLGAAIGGLSALVARDRSGCSQPMAELKGARATIGSGWGTVF